MVGSTLRASAIQMARKELLRQPVYLDTETTGLEQTDEIIEICALDHEGSVLVDSLVKPGRRIPQGAARIHGITDEMVATAPTWCELWPRIESAIADRRLAIYNSEFDLRMMQQTHRKNGLSWRQGSVDAFCVMLLYAQFYGERDRSRGDYRWQRLDLAVEQCRVQLPETKTHRARADALAARAVLQYMAQQSD